MESKTIKEGISDRNLIGSIQSQEKLKQSGLPGLACGNCSPT